MKSKKSKKTPPSGGDAAQIEELSNENETRPLVRLANLSKTYVTGFTKDGTPIDVHALRKVDLIIYRAEFTAVVGENGSGKSTLIHCLGSLERPDDGSQIEYYDEIGDSHNIWDNPSWYRQNFVGIIFQSFHLLPNLTVLQNVALPLQLKECGEYSPEKRVRDAKASSALTMLGLAGKERARIHQISGGQMQRAAIARAVIKKPRLILADEPTGNLDKKTKESIVIELRKLVDAGVSVVMVTHDEEYIKGVADRVIRLGDGIVIRDDRYAQSKRLSPFEHKTDIVPQRPIEEQMSKHSDVIESLPVSEAIAPSVEGCVLPDGGMPLSEAAPSQQPTGAKSIEFTNTSDSQASNARSNVGPPAQDERSSTSTLQELTSGPKTSGADTDSEKKGSIPVNNPGQYSKLVQVSNADSPQETTTDNVKNSNIAPSSLPVSNSQDLTFVAPPTTPNVPAKRLFRPPPSRKHIFAQRISDLIRLATRDALEAKVSLFSNVAAILFGTILTGILVSLLVGMNGVIENLIPTIPGIDSVRVSVDYSTGAKPINVQEFSQLQSLPGAVVAIPNIQQFAMVYKNKDRDTIVSISSSTTNDPDLKKLKTLAGQAEVNPEAWEIVIPMTVAEEIDNFNPLGLAEKNLVLVLRRYKRTENVDTPEVTKEISYTVRVVGIVQNTPKQICYGSLNMVRFLRDFSTGRTEYAPENSNTINPQAISSKTLFEGVRVHFGRPALAENAYKLLRQDKTSRFDVFWPGSELEYLRDVELLAAIILVGIGLLATISGSISIFNTLMASVARKAKDFGILRALGFSASDVFLIVLWQAMLMGILAGILGLILCVVGNSIINRLVIRHWPELTETLPGAKLFVLPVFVSLVIFATVILICILSGIVPSFRAAKRTPMDSLRTL